MSVHLVIGNMDWSRRRVMSALAGAATTLTSLAVHSTAAQAEAAAAWREYRNADLGFRVELPGEPKVEEQPGDASDPWIRTVEAQVELNDVLLGAHCTEYRAAIKADEQQKMQRRWKPDDSRQCVWGSEHPQKSNRAPIPGLAHVAAGRPLICR